MKVPPPAPWWEVMLARLLGRRTEQRDGSLVLIGYWWRGRLYLTALTSARHKAKTATGT